MPLADDIELVLFPNNNRLRDGETHEMMVINNH